MTHIQEFPLSVIEKLEYYVYLLIDPEINQIFYIGKGIGNRIFAHVNGAITDETPNDKLDKIREIRAKGLEVKHIVHRHGLTEKESFEVEAALIDFIGLSGLTNQVQGYNSDDRGQMAVAEVIAKYEAPIIEISEPVILITVNRYYRRGMSAEMLYEITRGSWVIGTRRNEAKYAFAVYKGIVREVYKIENWSPAPIGDTEIKRQWAAEHSINSDAKRTKRWQFEGSIADSLRHYVGGNVENYSKIGAQNPIRYVNC